MDWRNNEAWRKGIDVNKLMESSKQRMEHWSKQRKQDVARFAEVMKTCGWPFPYHITIYQLHHFKEMFSRISNAEKLSSFVDEWMQYFYRDSVILEILKDWETTDFLKNRIHILSSAIKSFINNDPIASISTLLPQVEGLVAEIMNTYVPNIRMNTSKYKDFLIDLLTGKEIFTNEDATKVFVLEILLAQFEHGKPIQSLLSRHAVLHGADTSYGDKTKALKLIILFDNLKIFISDYEYKESTIETEKNPPLEVKVYLHDSPDLDVLRRMIITIAQGVYSHAVKGVKYSSFEENKFYKFLFLDKEQVDRFKGLINKHIPESYF